jgi:hypothetical protein
VVDSVCPSCPKRQERRPSEWLTHIWYLFLLQRGGYPFEKNDLSVEEWIDLGIVREHFEAMKAGYG